MNKQRQQLFGMMLLAIMSFMPLTTMAEYYVSEVTLSPGQQTKVYLPDMYVEAMTRYGSGYPYTWSSDNSNVCTATTYRSRTYCNIYAKSVGTTKIHYHGEYYRNGVIYDYDCYWDVKVISSGGEGDDTGVDTPTGDPNEPADKWGVSGNYDIKWYDKNQSTFEIATNRELAGLAYLVNNGYSDFTGKTIKITEDISLSGKSWSSIGTNEKQFNGTFDGQGHVLGGLYIGRQNENQQYFGFFGYLGNNSVVRNVTLQGEISIVNPIYTDTKYSGTHYVGGLAGYCKSTNIEKCKCEMIVKYSRNVPNGGYVKNVYIGGMFGYFSGKGVISYCSHEGDVSCIQTPSDAGYSDVASAYVGGLIGNNSGDSWGDAVLEYCENVSTTISCEVPTNRKAGSWTNVGGLFAKGYGKVEHCRNICNFDIKHHGFAYSSSSISVSIGGIGGESTATTIDCYSSVQKAVVTSSRLDNVYYSGIGGNSNTSKANFSNSDVSIQTSRPLSRNYDGSTAFTSAQMQTPAFLEGLNMYSILEGDGAVWTQDDGGFPYFAKFHEEPDVIVTSIILNKSSLSLQTGQTETLTATVKPDNATDKTVTWSSSNANIATVDSEGKVTAVATGEATITCTANDDSGVSATCEVTVKTVPQSITIPSTMTVVSGQTVTLTPTITPADAETTLTWSSDDESIATVSSEGVVTGVKAGQTFINVTTDNGKTAYCKLTVTEPIVKVTDIILDVSTLNLEEGKSQTLGVTVKPDNATDKTVTWSSNNTSVATVDNSGKVTAVAAGIATITCTASDGSGVSASCEVTVQAVPVSITIPTPITIVAGQTVTLTPTITPANAVTTLTWSSDDETIATVNSEGVVTGVKKGQTFINVKTDNGLKAHCKLTVTTPEVIKITIPENVTLTVGEKLTLTAILTPEDAETTLTWKSDDETIVRVSADGELTGVAEGLALVTVTASNGVTSNACKVKVEPDLSGINDVQKSDKSTPVYTLSGQRLTAPKKGINIVGGRKVVVK